MAQNADKPLIVQSDRSVLLETDTPAFEDARDALAAFAELVKSPEHIHTYRISPLSLWIGWRNSIDMNASGISGAATSTGEARERAMTIASPNSASAIVRQANWT